MHTKEQIRAAILAVSASYQYGLNDRSPDGLADDVIDALSGKPFAPWPEDEFPHEHTYPQSKPGEPPRCSICSCGYPPPGAGIVIRLSV